VTSLSTYINTVLSTGWYQNQVFPELNVIAPKPCEVLTWHNCRTINTQKNITIEKLTVLKSEIIFHDCSFLKTVVKIFENGRNKTFALNILFKSLAVSQTPQTIMHLLKNKSTLIFASFHLCSWTGHLIWDFWLHSLLFLYLPTILK